jgi:prolipoprotein diacylglyceryltransferase
MPLASLPSPPQSVWHLGPLPFRAQALCVVAGILLAVWIADRRYRRAGGPRGVIVDVAAWAVPAGLIPAAIGALVPQADSGVWQAVRTWDAVLGWPGAAALGTLAAWLACRHLRPDGPGRRPGRRRPRPGAAALSGTYMTGASAVGTPASGEEPAVRSIAPAIRPAPLAVTGSGGRRLRFGPVAAAAAPAIAFGQAVASLAGWFAGQGYGHPSSLPWAVAIDPAHRPAGYENFATFQPLFLYQAVWGVAAGVGVAVATQRLALRGDRALALYGAAYAIGGFAMFWLGIAHLPIVLGLRAGELGDAAVFVGTAIYLVRTRPTRIKPLQPAQKPALESDSPVM